MEPFNSDAGHVFAVEDDSLRSLNIGYLIMTKFITTRTVVTFIAIALTSVSASAASYGGLGYFGTYPGTFSGNDSESALFDDFGLIAPQNAHKVGFIRPFAFERFPCGKVGVP